jgi:hypothetical protein
MNQKNSLTKLMLLIPVLAMTGCVPFWQTWRPREPVTTMPNGTPLRESWCYTTLAQADCYDKPQDVDGGGLISVDPPSRIPMTHEEYMKRVAESR